MLYATVRQRKIHVKNPTTVIQNGVGVDYLTLSMDEEWEDMDSVVCVFTTKYMEEEMPETEESDEGEAAAAAEEGETTEEEEETAETVMVEKEIVKEVLLAFGVPVLVPWECLEKTGSLSVSCTGYVGGEKVMTTMMPDSFWTIVQNGPVTGEKPMEATPSLYEQVLAAAGDANKAADTANKVSAELKIAREKGEFDGISPTIEVGSVISGTEAKITNSGTPQNAVLNFVLPRGVQGQKGEPGRDGRDGKDGKDGTATKEGIIAALGYTPMGAAGGMDGQFAISDGQGGIRWLSLTNVGEVGA